MRISDWSSDVCSSDLLSAQGKAIPRENVDLFVEHYIMLYAKSSPVGCTGYWPDALAPLKNTFSMDAQYAVVANRPIWVDVFIPDGTAPGLYQIGRAHV